MSANSDPLRGGERSPATDRYYYRRSLEARDLLPAIGIGLAAGALAYYVARILFERTPLVVTGPHSGRASGDPPTDSGGRRLKRRSGGGAAALGPGPGSHAG